MADLEHLSGNEYVFLQRLFRDENAHLGRSTKGTKQPEAKTAAIAGLQQFLRDKGLYKKGIDGDFGRGTEKAVKAFQESHHLETTGVVDENTFKAIEAERTKTIAKKHSLDLTHIARGDQTQENEVQETLMRNRSGALMLVESELSKDDGKTGILHEIGRWIGTDMHVIPDHLKRDLIKGNPVEIEGEKFSLDEATLRDSPALKTEMERLAKVLWGGDAVAHDFSQSAQVIATASDRQVSEIRGKK